VGEADMDSIAGFIHAALSSPDDATAIAGIAEDVAALCLRFPIYPERSYAAAD
jgi:glycine/serine hydroxymethyltransferase